MHRTTGLKYDTSAAGLHDHTAGGTLKVVKKNSPGESCRKRTPLVATGASRNTTRSLEKQKHTMMATSAARAPTNTLHAQPFDVA
jgi:hypothetical protein